MDLLLKISAVILIYPILRNYSDNFILSRIFSQNEFKADLQLFLLLLKISHTPQFHQDFQAILRSLGGSNSQSYQLDSSLSSLSELNQYPGSVTLSYHFHYCLRSTHAQLSSSKSPFPVTCRKQSQQDYFSHGRLVCIQMLKTTSAEALASLPSLYMLQPCAETGWEGCMRKKLTGPLKETFISIGLTGVGQHVPCDLFLSPK